MASRRPIRGEYHRYIGHPMATCLSAVLYPRHDVENQLDPNNPSDADLFSTLLEIAPGLKNADTEGSMNGTAKPDIGPTPERIDQGTFNLYSSPEDIAFVVSKDPKVNDALGQDVMQQRIGRSEFLFTTNSKAPEVTQFGTPRICMRPLYTGLPAGKASALDQLVAFCSTLNGIPYYWQRRSWSSRHNDIYSQAPRDEELIDYIRRLSGEVIPGFGSSFAQKYGNGPYDDRDQIVVSMFDYIRNSNLFDAELAKTDQYGSGSGGQGYGQVAGICYCGGTQPHVRRWYRETLQFPKGIGRIYTVSEVAMTFITVARVSGSGQAEGDLGRVNEAGMNLNGMPAGTKLVEVGFIIEGFAPSQGFSPMTPYMTAAVSGLAPANAGGDAWDTPPDMGFNGGRLTAMMNGNYSLVRSVANPLGRDKPYKNWRSWGGEGGFQPFSDGDPTFRQLIAVPPGQQLQMQGGQMLVSLFDDANLSVNNVIQAFKLEIPALTIDAPDYRQGAMRLRDRLRQATLAGDPTILVDPARDVVQSLVPVHGDYRLIAANRVNPLKVFSQHHNWGNGKMAHSLTMGSTIVPGATFESAPIRDLSYPAGVQPDFPNWDKQQLATTLPVVKGGSPSYDSSDEDDYDKQHPMFTGDFDTGISISPDGSYMGRANDPFLWGLPGSGVSGDPYFDNLDKGPFETRSARFSIPNTPSPVLFGSLPSGAKSHVPWRTLLFRPDPKKDTNDEHYGSQDPPDHLWLDYFWMPVVEPYAISEPFATAGKINLNYKIYPFRHIHRATAMHALLKSEKVIAVPDSDVDKYKTGTTKTYRHPINEVETLKQWEDRFEDDKLFRSASEICEMFLVPKVDGETAYEANDMETFWSRNRLTGDNLKERPYVSLYPRVTTRSNTFRVYYTVETLRKVRGTDPAKWVEGTDLVTGRMRGSALIERLIDPNDPDLPDYATEEDAKPLDYYYRYRVTNLRQFNP